MRAWHEVKAQGAEVARMAQELAGHVRDWLDRAIEHVRDRLGPEQSELALAGGREDHDSQPDLATRLREAWAARQARLQEREADGPERDAPDDLAARLRAAAAGIDRDELADRAAALREGREAEERQKAQEVARQDYRETHQITIGFLEDRMVVMVWTQRGTARRIISLRKANEREQRAYAGRF